jgi:ABC-2 type transport system permease protein
MNLRRISAVLMQEWYMTTHSLEVVVDAFLFPLVNIVVLGLISAYFGRSSGALSAHYVFLGMLLWQIVGITAYSVGVGAMWNIWSKNLSNMFITPLRVREYSVGLFFSGCLKAIVLIVFGMVLSQMFFGFDVREVGVANLIAAFVILSLFGLAMAIAILGVIFRFGTRLAALAWSLPWFFQPLSAAFFPLTEMPHGFQLVARLLPPTYAFEGVRTGLSQHLFSWNLYAQGVVLDVVYLVIGTLIFMSLYRLSRESGQFARNES